MYTAAVQDNFYHKPWVFIIDIDALAHSAYACITSYMVTIYAYTQLHCTIIMLVARDIKFAM